MLAAGWLEEVRGLLSQNHGEDAKPFDFIGYRELRDVLRGKMTLADARVAIQQSTRQYAKRQLTWFRREKDVHWFAGFGDDGLIQKSACEFIASSGISRPRGGQSTGV
jgi:tRNA A37 N6-isopentenylltransferase MiaA